MSNQKKKISRERKKWLKKQLKLQMGDAKKYLYIAAIFQWLQFLMRVVAFGWIAKAASDIYYFHTTNIVVLASVLFTTTLIGLGVSWCGKQYQGIPSQVARNRLKREFLRAYQQTEGNLAEVDTKADVVTVAAQGIDTLDTFYQSYQTTMIKTYLNCATILAIVTIIFPLGGLIFLVSLPFIPVAMIMVQKKSKKIMERYWATYMDVGNLFIDNLRGLNTLYHYQVERNYQKNFVKKAEAFRLSTMELLAFQLQSVGYMDAVMYVGIGVSGFVAAYALEQGNLSLFSVIFFILIATEFFAPIRELGYGMHLLMMNTKMADHIFTFLEDAKQQEKSLTNSTILAEQVTQLRVEKLTFAYDNNPVLKQVSATFNQGELTAISGESGVGKSTLVKLLKKQLTSDEGDIFFNSTSISQLTSQDIWRHCVVVSSDSYLFNDSITNNLLMASTKSKAELREWLDRKELLPFVDQLPQGLETIVGENGALLSPGQRQQILCVRALLANRDIYLFDEITSSVDPTSEADVMNLIKKIAQDKIVLLITHKMKQVAKADKVLFLGKQQQFSFMSPQELQIENAEYQTLVETQAELEAVLDEYKTNKYNDC